MRLFVAVDLSDDVRESIHSLQNVMRTFNLKFVEKQNIHITLKFIGEVNQVEMIKEKLREVKMSPFRAHFKGIGFFPAASHIRVIWVGVDEGKDEMIRLAKMVEKAVKSGSKKDFVAHATIARIRSISTEDKKRLLRELELYMEKDFGWMDVKDFRLKKSTLTSSGPVYSDLAIYKLEG
jgi:2'-5' RNA ligase